MTADATPVISRAQRCADWIHARRWWLLGGWLVHAVVIHALFLGIPSWDGYTYHLPPMVDLIQHGELGYDKYWAFPFTGFVPFAELVQLPLLAALGLPGLLITGPLIVFPLCVVAVYKLGRKLTGSAQAGTFAALAYGAIPMINDQPFSGYIDFIVSASLAYFVYGLLELRHADRPWRAAIRVVVATAILTLTKQSGIYICGMLSALLFVALFLEREGNKLRVVGRRALGIAIVAITIGALPELCIQIGKYITHGTPIYPYQFDLLGVKLGVGVPMKEIFFQSGLADDTPREFARNFVAAWIWPSTRPHDLFDSRHFGGGWVLVTALALLPVFLRSATRFEKWLGISCVIVSVFARDFFYPRFSYTLVVGICVVIGRAMFELARAPRGRWRFWLAGAVLVLHLARPEYDLWQVRQSGPVGYRIDVLDGPWFQSGPGVLEPVPDLHARLVIVDYTRNGFLLPLYGRRLTNEIEYTVPAAQVGPRCAGLRFLAARDPTALFVDELDRTVGCDRVCGISDRWGWCRAWQLFPVDHRASDRGAGP